MQICNTRIVGLIPQCLQLCAQITLASLGSCYKSGECVSVVRAMELSPFVCYAAAVII